MGQCLISLLGVLGMFNLVGLRCEYVTWSARLNLFFKAVRSLAYDLDLLHELLLASWNEDALDTLKIIFQTRDCRGGKGEKKLFAECLLWLATHHPETLSKNLKHIPYFGTWKDLLVLVPTPFADEVLRLFANQLREDLQKVKDYKTSHTEVAKNDTAEKENSNDTSNSATNPAQGGEIKPPEKPRVKKERPPLPFISLAAKWAPAERHGNDKKTGSALKLAILLSEGNPKTVLRDYRKNYLTPLRAHLQIIETYTCAQRWGEIPYSLVPSRSMDLHKKEFEAHDTERFAAYLEAVKAGESTIKGKQMLPHELVERCLRDQKAKDLVVELQWQTIVEQTRKMGSLAGSLVLSDVSTSMTGIPMLVSVALGLLISELTPPPFTNCVVTFHTKPSFHIVSGASLHDRAWDLKGAKWGGSTNFQAVFDLILDRASENKVPPEHMPKKLFVISDMQFNRADANYVTNFQAVKQRYKDAGYTLPQMVFWNVNGSQVEFPVTQEELGVAMVSGFSASILRSLLKMGEFISPLQVFQAIIGNPRYNVLNQLGFSALMCTDTASKMVFTSAIAPFPISPHANFF
eukprot:Phypoly_transcript_03842.p1 GENE.Phypoly_transcript_03842~~Phypoly_transcript_03842.p1  ORF type:complete len:604 (-),score=57.53 Phypoly_transcript_03842:525-2252(-)